MIAAAVGLEACTIIALGLVALIAIGCVAYWDDRL